MTKHFYYLLGGLFLLASCSSAPSSEAEEKVLAHQKHGDYQVTHLPLSQNWRTFQCREGMLEARYLDSGKKSLAIRLERGSQFTLQRRASYDPAIFENERLSFYVNEKTAVLGRPSSSTLIMTGCLPR